MGGRVSKAKRACMTSKTENFSGSLTDKGGSVSVTKNYDTKCVQDMLK